MDLVIAIIYMAASIVSMVAGAPTIVTVMFLLSGIIYIHSYKIIREIRKNRDEV